jgi:hypothetical protein
MDQRQCFGRYSMTDINAMLCPSCLAECKPTIFDGYFACRNGHIVSVWDNHSRKSRPHVLASTARRGKHAFVRVQASRKRRTVDVHRLVANAFLPPRPEGFVTRHLDGDCHNNEAVNLVWGTTRENEDDKFLHGAILRGSRHPCSKLTEDVVSEIKRLIIDGCRIIDIARKFGRPRQTISNIKSGSNWGHVTPKPKSDEQAEAVRAWVERELPGARHAE